MLPAIATGIFSIGNKLIDHWFPDAEEADKRKAEMAMMIQSGEMKKLEISMSAILAEANSEHTIVALARPMFMYLFYLVTIMLVIIFPIIGIFNPEAMDQLYLNVDKGFKAIPSEMWTTFTVGFLGYTGAREFGKHSKRKNEQ